MRFVNQLGAITFLHMLVLMAGCASSGRASESEKALSTMGEANAQLDEIKVQVNKSLASLDSLSGGDLEKSYKAYHSAVGDLQKSGDKARDRWKDMQARGADYVKKWEAESTSMSPEVRAGMQERSAKAKANYQNLQSAAKKAADAYKPFMKEIQDIDKALSLDLSSGGVQSIQPAISKAKTNAQVLNQSIDALKAQVDQIRMGMSGPPKS